jgi:MFS family permease
MASGIWLQLLKQNRSLRLMLAALFTSVIGNGLFYVALSLEVLTFGGARNLSIVLGAFGLAQLLVAPFAGVIADRYRRTRVMFIADLLQFGGTLAFAILGHANLALFCLFALIAGTGASLFRPASSALLSDVLTGSEKRAGNALRTLVRESGTVLGPLLGALLISAVTANELIMVDALTFVISAGADLFIAETKPGIERKHKNEAIFSELRQGFRAVGNRPWLNAIFVSTAVQSLMVVSAEQALVPFIAVRHYGAATLGFLVAAEAVGAILGGAFTLKYSPRRRGLVAQLATLTGALWLAALAFHLPVALLLVLSCLVGIGFSVFGVLYTTALQDQVPDQQLGRVFSLDQVVRLGFVPLGLVLVSALLAVLSPSVLLLAAAVVGVLAGLVPLVVPGCLSFTDPVAPRTEDAHALSSKRP